MAKTKIYFWLKIDKKFFDNIFIKRLKTVPGGYTMTVIYIRLMLESLDSDCILYYEGYFETLKEELALKLDVSEDDIDMTMAYFTKCGLIQIDEDKNAELPQAKALVMSETNWASYKRKQRQNKERLENVQKSLTNSNSCPTEIELEKEQDIKLDIKSEVDIRENQPAADNVKPNFNIYEYYQQRIGVIDGYQGEKLRDYVEIDKMEPMLVKRALDRAADNGKRNFGYINAILKNWAQNGILTVAQQDEEQRNFEEQKNKPSRQSKESVDGLPEVPF